MGNKNDGTVPFLWCVWLCSSFLSPSLVAAREPHALSVTDVLNARILGESSPIRFSPNGKWLAYVARDNRKTGAVPFEMLRTGVGWAAMSADIYIVDARGGEVRNLTGGQGDNWLATWSPDGHYLAFLSDRDGTDQAELWVWDTIRNDLRRLSDVSVRADDIQWTPDSQKILVTTLPEGLTPEVYANRVLLDNVNPSLRSSMASGSTVRLYESGPIGSERAKPQRSDPWSLEESMRDLGSVDITTGKYRPIVRGRRIGWYLLSPDGSRIAYAIPKRFEKPGSQQILYDLVTVRLLTNAERTVASDVRLVLASEMTWSPDSLHLAYRTFGMEEKVFNCYVVAADAGTPRSISTLQPPQQQPSYVSLAPLWSSDGKHVYFINNGALWRASVERESAVEIARIPDRTIVQMVAQPANVIWAQDGGPTTVVLTRDSLGKQDGFYKINLATRENRKLLEQDQCYTCSGSYLWQFAAVTPDGRGMAFVAEDRMHPADVWTLDPSLGNAKRLTTLNPFFDNYTMGTTRLINWLSDDGDRLHGALLFPANYKEGERYPLIVWVYGGWALADDINRFGLAYAGLFNMQLLATRGYAVLLPDAPQHMGTPMFDLAKTILPGVNKAIDMGIADPDRLGVMGHSYGGYSTLSLIVQTKRFKAAIELSGYADVMGAYGAMDKNGTAFSTSIDEEGQGLMGGTPWQYRDRYIENSPIFYLDRVETPLLIIHGSEDTAPPSFLGDEVFVGLRRLGKEVVYAKYKGEEHDPTVWTFANRLDYCSRMIDWFEKHLKVVAPRQSLPSTSSANLH
jgi:dipeptidyl aminopeptidase/acylaminoacyl peptidase